MQFLMKYLPTPFQVNVLQQKLSVRIIVFATDMAMTQPLFLLHSPLRVEEASLEQILLFMQEATPAEFQQLPLLLLILKKLLDSL